ncbi:alpha/beta hydrolase [Staphylococcus sp. SQ8-PEA]|uniref:Alpha/beta hydrolase n=1 Tax=Staphylococcus marylandisciuri TaxID=2981529 RepID=A0ABT2QN70_9STAP|nr:alpha/beta hydrolase [Staphylococcus marylandisciuri]MCU5745420.1 alpha/beta hydrolase [Staphylococcus marylandisciuri]
MAKELKYGQSEEQYMQIYDHSDNEDWIVIVHGGYWRQRISVEIMEPFAEQLFQQGYNVVNIEYRRGDHRWPIPEEDVALALETFKSSDFFKESQALITLGHSVGGQLVLNTQQYADRIVALAPVTDVKFTKDQHLGEDAALEYFGEASDDALYAASPLSRLPIEKPTYILHGIDDEKVRIETTFDFIAKNNSDLIELCAPAQLDHMYCINPQMPYFNTVLKWIEEKA